MPAFLLCHAMPQMNCRIFKVLPPKVAKLKIIIKRPTIGGLARAFLPDDMGMRERVVGQSSLEFKYIRLSLPSSF